MTHIFHTSDPEKGKGFPAFKYYCITKKPDGTSQTEHKTVYTTSKKDFLDLIDKWNRISKSQWKKGHNFYHYVV